jgi:hypothetical protein
MEKKFYLIDADSENYFVSQIARTDDQITKPLRDLEVGQTYWATDRYGWERCDDRAHRRPNPIRGRICPINLRNH